MQNRRVLIVDDHPRVRAGLRMLVMEDLGMQVVGEATNGLDAIRDVGQFAPDLVLMDITMPGMNGIQATAEIKRRYPAVRVLIVSVHDVEEYVQASMEAGADGYILKDAARQDFRLAVRNAFGTAAD